MATVTQCPFAGSAIYWGPAKSTNLPTLKQRWEAMGLGDYVPEPRTPMACLKAAIADVFNVDEVVDDPKLETRVIEPQPKGFVVGVKRPKVHKTPGQSIGTAKVSITMDDQGEIDMDPWDAQKVQALKEGMAGAKLWLPSGSVVPALREIVTMWGLALGSRGGWYWVSDDMLPSWEQVEASLLLASAKQDRDGNDVAPWVFDHLDLRATNSTVAAIIRHLKEEAASELRRIEYDLNEGSLGQRGIERREQQAQHLLDKVAKFENTLQVDLTELTQLVQRTQAAAAMAKLAAIVKAEQEQGVAA